MRILLFENNEFFKDALIRIILQRFPDVDIKKVLSRKECLNETRELNPDILMLGVNVFMGKNRGLLEQLRESNRGVTIILFTDYDIEEYRKDAILRGVNYIIPKELLTGHEILALVSTILSTKDSGAAPQPEELSGKEEFLKRPIERRRRDSRARIIEREYLAHNPDRRG